MRTLRTLACLALACVACHSSQPPPAGASAGSAAPAAPGSTTIGFDRDPAGALPAGWKAQGTKPSGPDATWAVTADAKAASAPNVLSLTAVNHESTGTFNLCWTSGVKFLDGTLEVALRADAGEADQGGGPVWRVQDADNYYICRLNPLESNFRLYVVKAGTRKQLATASAKAQAGEWHRVRVEHAGKKITVSLDGTKLLEAEDDSLPGAGGVGVWTKADARSSFDDLKITPAGG